MYVCNGDRADGGTRRDSRSLGHPGTRGGAAVPNPPSSPSAPSPLSSVPQARPVRRLPLRLHQAPQQLVRPHPLLLLGVGRHPVARGAARPQNVARPLRVRGQPGVPHRRHDHRARADRRAGDGARQKGHHAQRRREAPSPAVPRAGRVPGHGGRGPEGGGLEWPDQDREPAVLW